ncbi:MAG: hypothetical protein JWR04_214 [Rhodoglobus sp.]|jgi:hypothetical protein|nr:hypothetical protein [Rhodoglobus sp.]
MRWGIGSLVVVVLLAGCTAPPPPIDPEPTPTAVSLGPVGTVLAVGEFDPADGVTGTVELTVAPGGRTRVSIIGFTSTLPAEASLQLSPYPLTAERRCIDGFAFDLGLPPYDNDKLDLDLTKFGGDDPSFLDGAVISMGLRDGLGCVRTILARAPFAWSIPDMRPGLTVIDSGTASGAHGAVVTDADGAPVEYTVASGDVYSAIADRFGISVDDLDYLNPYRNEDGAIADEVLNLDRDNRSGPKYLG